MSAAKLKLVAFDGAGTSFATPASASQHKRRGRFHGNVIAIDRARMSRKADPRREEVQRLERIAASFDGYASEARGQAAAIRAQMGKGGVRK
jgi:hypothetical protein